MPQPPKGLAGLGATPGGKPKITPQMSPKECCDAVSKQLAEIADWQKWVWDNIWGGGGNGAPPPPPTWP